MTTAAPTLWITRLIRITPASAEVMVNFVVQHSLHLQRSNGDLRPGGR